MQILLKMAMRQSKCAFLLRQCQIGPLTVEISFTNSTLCCGEICRRREKLYHKMCYKKVVTSMYTYVRAKSEEITSSMKQTGKQCIHCHEFLVHEFFYNASSCVYPCLAYRDNC